jgi:hypothetical protein
MKAFRSLITIGVALTLVMGLSGLASAKKRVVTKPKANSVYGRILSGLTLIKNGKYDEWIDGYCHPDQCPTLTAKKAMRQYNLPAMQKRAVQCIRGKKQNKLRVTRVIKNKDGSRKIFIKCYGKASPYPFTLKRVKVEKKKVWMWYTC